MKQNKRGVSLIVLVITIIVIIILASAVILTINNNNPIESANKATFQSNMRTYLEQMQLYYGDRNVDEMGQFKMTDIYASTPSEVKKYIATVKKQDEAKVKIMAGELVYITKDNNEIAWANEIGIIAGEDGIYLLELKRVQDAISQYIHSGSTEIVGSSLQGNPVEIRGILYGESWYRLEKGDLDQLGVLDSQFAPYIYQKSTGNVLNIAGRIINGNPVHSLNYTSGNELVKKNMLTGADSNSVKTPQKWGEISLEDSFTGHIENGYTEDGGLKLNTLSKIGVLPVNQERPINETYSVNVTVKGSTMQLLGEGIPSTIVALSDVLVEYVLWMGVINGYLQVYTFRGYPNALYYQEGTEKGFCSIDVKKYDGKIMNVQVTAKRDEKTKVYINGALVKEFESGSNTFTYKTLTIGDLRVGRGLKYIGVIYNFALYSEILNEEEILANWNYTKNSVGK